MSKYAKKWVGVVCALFFIVFASGCGGGGGGAGTTTTGLSGTVANGLAVPNAKVTVQSAQGETKDVGTTDASGQYTGFAFPDGFAFPAMMTVTLPNGKDVLRSIIPSLPGTTATSNINPITQAITSQVLPTGTSLASLDVSSGANGFASKAKTVVQAALGDAVDYDTFAGKPMQARTADNPKAGGLADTLIDTIAGMDATRKPEDILASASDTKDPTVAKSLMTNPAFQARLAGELVAQGRQASDVATLIGNEAASGANTATILANTKTFAASFQDMYTSASAELTGSDAQKRATLESVVQSAAVAVAKIVDKKGVTSGDSLINVVTNSMSLVKGPLITIGKTNQGGTNLDLIVEATRDQMSDLITTSTTDLTQSGANIATLGTQVKNFGEIVSSAVANSLNSGKDKSGLDDKKKLLVATNIGKGIASSLTSFMSDLAVDSSAMTDAQKANLGKAQNTAKNAATALDSALVGMASDTNGGTLETEVMNSMAEALVTQASETFKTYDLTVDATAFSSAAGKVLTNMATLVVNNAAAFHSSAATLDTGRQAALTGAMAQQLFNEVKSLDLTGDAPPDTALHVATNMAQAMGPALVEKVGQGSTYLGSNLQVLAASALSTATTQLKETTPLTGAIDATTLGTLQQKAAQAAETSKTSMEASFKKFEDQGITLADVTAGLAEAGLAGGAIDVVMTQIQSTMVSGGDSMKGAARDIAETAANMAQAVLVKGGTLAQVQSAVASPLAAMAQVAAGQTGQSAGDILNAVRNSANTLGQAVQAMGASKEMSLDNMILTAGNVSSLAATQLSGDAANQLLTSIRDNAASGGELKLDTLAGQLAQFDPNILAKASTQQAVLQDQAKVILQTTNKLPEFLPFPDKLLVEIGQTFTGRLPVKDDQTGKILTFKIVTNGSLGTATITDAKTGGFSYQPKPGAVGDDTFTFVINDGIGETPPIQVAVNVVNKLPVFMPPPQELVAKAGQPITGILPVKDAQAGVEVTFKIIAQGTKGTVTLTDAKTGAYTYQPNPGAFGPDTFSFSVTNGVGETPPMPMTVHVQAPPPEFVPFANQLFVDMGQTFTGLLPIKSNPTGATLAFKIVTNGTKGVATITNAATGAFSYRPNPSTTGADTFMFTISDGVNESSPSPVTINIVNVVPKPVVSQYTVDAGQSVSGTFSVPNPEGNILTYRIDKQGLKGTATITNQATGAFTFAAQATASGPDFFTFIVNNGVFDSDPVAVNLTINSSTAATNGKWGTMVWGQDKWSAN
ncbi:MAG: tandem-95 repeat protein [Magnetococcus sp. THC-1_WYH]